MKDILDHWKPAIQPLTDDEIDLIASVGGVTPEKVRCIAWLVTMKLRAGDHSDGAEIGTWHEQFDGEAGA